MRFNLKTAFPRPLAFFVFCYPLVFFPGALFHKPTIITPQDINDASEQFLYLPKLLLLIVVGTLGSLELRHKHLRYPFLFLLLGYLVLAFFSTLNAHDMWAYNLLGGNLRFDGLIYQVSLVLFGIYAFIYLLEQSTHLYQIAVALVGAGFVQTIIVLLQRFKLDPVTPLRQYTDFNQPIGTLGHPGMVAAILLPALIVGFFYSLQMQHRVLWMIATLLVAVGLGITGNSASFFALIAVLVGVNTQQRQGRILLLSVGVLTALLVPRAVLPNPASYNQDYGDTRNLETRFHIWKITWLAIIQTPLQPLLGGGPDALKLAQLRKPPLDEIAAFYALEYAWPANAMIEDISIKKFPGGKLRDQWIEFQFSRFGNETKVSREYSFGLDRAHNYFLDRWVAYGLLSALIWLIIYLYPVARGLFGKDSSQQMLAWTLAALFVYYLAWFPVMQVEPVHMVLLAAAWALLSTSSPPKTT